MYREPAAWHELMERLSAMVVGYLQAQLDAGADVVQLFDSWVGGLGPADYQTYVQPHVRRIFASVQRAPAIHFGTGTAALLELLADAGGDVIGLDHRVSLGEAWQRVGYDRGVQGNLDSARLLAGWEPTRDGAQAVLDAAAGRPGHVFNLGHGVLPETDTDLLRRLVDFVHEQTAGKAVGAAIGAAAGAEGAA
jgi:uroporphyrinogen decarboxylase